MATPTPPDDCTLHDPTALGPNDRYRGPVRRFALFANKTYYAAGGGHDLRGSFEDLQDAARYAADCVEYETSATRRAASHDSRPWDWWHVLDLHTGAVVARGEPAGGQQ